MKTSAIGFTFLLLLVSCGNDRESKANALNELDSRKKELIELRKTITELEDLLVQTKGELEVAKDDINQVKEFQVLRSEQEREQQIRNATAYKIKIENRITKIEDDISTKKESVKLTENAIRHLEEYLKN